MSAPFAPGGALHASWEIGPVGLVAGVAGGAPWEWQVGPARVDVVRIPVDVGIRAIARGHRFAVAVEGGPLLAWLHVAGRDPGQPAAARLQGGVRAALLARAEVGILSPYVTVWGEWAAPRYPIALEPDGPVGRIPSFWLGIALGVGARVH
jgi:hypothetical protein